MIWNMESYNGHHQKIFFLAVGLFTETDKPVDNHGTPEKMTIEEFIESNCDPRDLALVFHACFERLNGGREDLEKRADAAKEWYKYFTGIDL